MSVVVVWALWKLSAPVWVWVVAGISIAVRECHALFDLIERWRK